MKRIILALVLSVLSFGANAAEIVSWGYDSDNQVTNTPTGNDFVSVAAGSYHGLALKDDGSIESWGSNFNNLIAATPAGTDFIAVAGGNTGSLA